MMKNSKSCIKFIFIFVLLLICQSCSRSRVYTVSDKDGYIKPGIAYGSTRIEDFDDFRLKQERSKTINVLEEQIRQAVIDKDENELKILLARREILLVNSSPNNLAIYNARVYLVNKYTKTIIVEDGVFKGEILAPGEKTFYNKVVPVGSYSFRVSTTNSHDKYITTTITRIISKNTEDIILKKVRM